ncbi:RNA-dependent RNA polymerase [Sclerotinia sclerotiorum mitovirus 3]|uniref:RNA-dependent RNA polymerase n=1 Tax=Sclerotinia sclerotiorum mitovirus 3 TaxID=1279099 RepID=A0ABM5NEA4_9VIRU|nr:RNA-dependent RNA polymerase [Sclerotinia sclerotiorum mitovirus 3]AGC24232.1 RNA-dependent RNA polymerase [Sclerotinia sclerotiorum mitovirus 3]
MMKHLKLTTYKHLDLNINQADRFSNGAFAALSLKLWYPYVRLLIWSLRLDKPSFMKFATRIESLWIHNGLIFTVKYLKECLRICQHFVSGNPVLVTTEMPISIVRGIPTIIPGNLRLLMHSRDLSVIRGVLSLLSVFRIMKIPSTLKLESITGPFTGLDSTLPKYELIKIKQVLPVFPQIKPIKLKLLRSAGPNCKVSMLGIWLDIKAWSQHPNFKVLIEFIQLFPNYQDFRDMLLQEAYNLRLSIPSKDLHLGKLAIKEEAAGKARVFAITDSITQSVMGPISDAIFKMLRQIPMDGTFNQSAPLDRLVQLSKDGAIPEKDRVFYSYDLSAATDRLPINLQKDILSIYCGESFALKWSILMTDRDWYLTKEKRNLRYSVGQPMGALSSWAMLALTHHFIVGLAANRVGKLGFDHYALLGDDIVIADKSVADSYYMIMTEILGVQINLSKSLVSTNSFEFAKRLVTLEGEVTPAGPANILLGLRSLNGIPSIILDMVNKGVPVSEESLESWMSTIPTVRKSQLEKVKWVVKGPFGFVPTAEGLASFLTMSSSLTPVRANQIIHAVRYTKFQWDLDMWTKVVKDNIGYRISISELYFPVGFQDYPLDFNESPIKMEIIKRLSQDLRDLGGQRPTFRLIFEGPIIMFNYYRQGYASEIVNYIKYLVHQEPEFKIGGSDPFLPRNFEAFAFSSKFKGQKFFEQVKEHLRANQLPF